MDIRGVNRFSSLMKYKIKGKNYAVFCFAGKSFFLYL
jgi:GTPase SAR1 family protein